MQLNNWLQGHGGTGRLTWNNDIAGGPRHRPNWHSECFGTMPLLDAAIARLIPLLHVVDGTLFGEGHGPSKGDAQEVAAGMTLAHLLSGHEAATPS
jgi:hypothetical protein